MAEKDLRERNSKLGSLKCKICSFPSRISTRELKETFCFLQKQLVGLLYEDGDLAFVDLANGEEEKQTLHGVARGAWCDNIGEALFWMFDCKGDLFLYSVEKENNCFTVDKACLESVLASKDVFLEQCPEFISCTETSLTLLINRNTLVMLRVTDDSLQCTDSFKLQVAGEPLHTSLCVHLFTSFHFVLDWASHKLYINELGTGCVAELDLQYISPVCGKIKIWALSTCLTLFVVTDGLMAVSIPLKDYVKAFPTMLRTLSPDTSAADDSDKDDSSLKSPTSFSKVGKTAMEHLFSGFCSLQSSKKRVSGLHDGSSVLVKFSNLISQERLPTFLLHYNAVDVTVSARWVAVVFKAVNDPGGTVLWWWDIQTGKTLLDRLECGQHIILSHNPCVPHLIVTENGMFSLIVDLGEEEFIDKVMLFGGARFVDGVCQMNNWGQRTLPLRALELGLKNHQLDTISMFLKSRQKMFSRKIQKNSSKLNGHFDSSNLWLPLSTHSENLNQLVPAFDLLLRGIRDSMREQQSRFFGHQLLGVTLGYLYGLLEDSVATEKVLAAGSASTSELEDFHTAVATLLRYIAEIRLCMSQTGRRRSTFRAEKVGTIQMHEYIENKSRWEAMCFVDAAEDAVKRNLLLYLQTYLREHNMAEKAHFSEIVCTVLRRALAYLENKKFEDALTLILNLGFNAAEKLWEFALYTNVTSLRAYILEELSKLSVFSNDQKEILSFFHQLQESYPCSSFVKTKESLLPCSGWTVNDPIAACMGTGSSHDMKSMCGEISPKSDTSQDYRGYCDVLLDWLKFWPPDTCQRILLEGKLLRADPLPPELDPRILLEYYLSHNMIDEAVIWLNENIGREENTEKGTLKKTRLLKEVLPSLSLCTTYVKERMLKEFARHTVINATMVEDFNHYIQLLAHSGGVLKVPHPLQDSEVSLQYFHRDFIQYCASQKLGALLWRYCDKHNIVLSHLKIQSIDQQTAVWLMFFENIYSVASNSQDLSLIYKASLANAAVVWGLSEDTDIEELVRQNQISTAMATAQYGVENLTPVKAGSASLKAFGDLKMEELEEVLVQFPRLHAAFFPSSIRKIPQQDITVYQLLRGNAPFDPARLFGWQSTNPLTGEDSLKSLPHFSLPELVSQYAPTEKIRFTYYLRQGRPTFAFTSFLAEELDAGPNLIPKRLHAACHIATKLGVKHFCQPPVAAASAAFIEMLGMDSLKLRLFVEVGSYILGFKNSALMKGTAKKRDGMKANEEEVAVLLLASLRQKKQYGRQLLLALEESVSHELEQKDGLLPTSFEAAQKWQLVLVLCHQLRLPYSTQFLEACAQENKWLAFIWFCQLHQYPKDQVQQLVSLFPSRHLRDHLFYVFENTQTKYLEGQNKQQQAAQESAHKTLHTRDVRSSLYAKIGVAKPKESGDQTSTDEEIEDAAALDLRIETESGKDDDEEFVVREAAAADDMFRVLFSAQATRCPWKSLLAHAIALRNPLFAELAACHKESHILNCLCGWLVSMMSVSVHANFLDTCSQTFSQWSLEELTDIMDVFMRNNWISTLATGFDIFYTESALTHFLQFLSACVEEKDYTECRNLLESFKRLLLCKHQRVKLNEGFDQKMIGNTEWLEQTCHQLLHYLLCNVDNIYEIVQLLNFLDQCNIVSVFVSSVPNYSKLHKVAQLIFRTKLPIPFQIFLSSDPATVSSEVQPYITQLLSQGWYADARILSELVGLPHDTITLQEVDDEKQKLQITQIWKSKLARVKFWQDCYNKFKCCKMSLSEIVAYFQLQATASSRPEEQAFLYQLCLDAIDLFTNHEDQKQLHDALHHKMWRCRILTRVQEVERVPQNIEPIDEIFAGLEETSPLHRKVAVPKMELLHHGKMPRINDKPTEFSDSEQRALNLLMGELLDEGRISQCCHVATEFSVYSQDLAIILMCIRLSVGLITVDELTPELKQLLYETENPRKSRHLSFSSGSFLKFASSANLTSMTSAGPDTLLLSADDERIVTVMENLYELCNQGRQCCRRILTAKKISLVLECNYENIISSDEFTVLEALLKTDCSQRFYLAREFFSASSLSDEEFAGFLSEAILKSLKACLGESRASERRGVSCNRDLIFNFADANENSAQFLKLCQNSSLLGDRLLDTVASLATDGGHSVLAIQTELLILAHTCHTAACSMEGISNVLRAARVLTQCLCQAEEFQLMIHLLTGVGRFSEMTYVFDILKQNHQFELLMRKGMDKEDRLKIAILDYLKRFHPNDSDSYTMVALNFTMYREIAQMLEELAQKNLIILKRKPLVNSSEVTTTLQKINQYFSDAAESYIKENSLRHAEYCVRQARLITLQLELLPSGVRVINLSEDAAVEFICQHPKFYDALVVSEAYSKPQHWGTALCKKVVIDGDFRYLRDFKANIRLTPPLVIDAVEKYKQLSQKPVQCLAHLKKFLSSCKDLKLQYQMARDLGMKDFLTALEKGSHSAYILDIASH